MRYLQLTLKTYLFLFTISLSGVLKGQSVFSANRYVTAYEVQTANDTSRFEPDNPVTAISVKGGQGPFYVYSESFSGKIPRDHEAEGNAFFISLPNPETFFSIISVSGDFDIYLISSGETPDVSSTGRINQTGPCDSPDLVISQTEWRDGLPEPNYNRSFSEVDHMIVHHSAGSNTSTNYIQVVRDIYLYHTEVNGWSDIGYNYLIAQDGSVFAGRDPLEGEQLTVRGAHFCGANTNTSGICMLGNYETALPTDEGIESLDQLLTFAFAELELMPFTSSSHSTGELTTLAGHRDGCATLCPGENLYSRIDEIRTTIQKGLRDCDLIEPPLLSFTASKTEVTPGEFITLTNTSEGEYPFEFITPEGAQSSSVFAQDKIQVVYYLPGQYDVTLQVSWNNQQISLTEENYITVSPENIPAGPNPVSAGSQLDLFGLENFATVDIFTLSGRKVKGFPVDNAATSVASPSQPGIYMVVYRNGARTKSFRLVVN